MEPERGGSESEEEIEYPDEADHPRSSTGTVGDLREVMKQNVGMQRERRDLEVVPPPAQPQRRSSRNHDYDPTPRETDGGDGDDDLEREMRSVLLDETSPPKPIRLVAEQEAVSDDAPPDDMLEGGTDDGPDQSNANDALPSDAAPTRKSNVTRSAAQLSAAGNSTSTQLRRKVEEVRRRSNLPNTSTTGDDDHYVANITDEIARLRQQVVPPAHADRGTVGFTNLVTHTATSSKSRGSRLSANNSPQSRRTRTGPGVSRVDMKNAGKERGQGGDLLDPRSQQDTTGEATSGQQAVILPPDFFHKSWHFFNTDDFCPIEQEKAALEAMELDNETHIERLDREHRRSLQDKRPPLVLKVPQPGGASKGPPRLQHKIPRGHNYHREDVGGLQEIRELYHQFLNDTAFCVKYNIVGSNLHPGYPGSLLVLVDAPEETFLPKFYPEHRNDEAMETCPVTFNQHPVNKTFLQIHPYYEPDAELLVRSFTDYGKKLPPRYIWMQRLLNLKKCLPTSQERTASVGKAALSMALALGRPDCEDMSASELLQLYTM
ncbi:unnamed protein product [Amoebophrya sp. A25]|nr:unnamed protein product [Amoebophrya sp. A25]|eukprot:GSA25T00027315001.1